MAASQNKAPVELPAEAPRWVPDEEVSVCQSCLNPFSLFSWKHHCRACGDIFCAECTQWERTLPRRWGYTGPQRVCERCFQRIDNLYNSQRVLRRKSEAASMALRSELIILVQQLLRSEIFPRDVAFIGEDEDIPGIRGNQKMYFRVNYTDPKGSSGSARREHLGLLTLIHPNLKHFVRYEVPLEFSQWLTSLRHTHIDPLLCCCWLNDRKLLLCLRRCHPKRSLADHLRITGALPPERIQLLGSQILDALLYFFSLGFPFGGCLHPGNVLLYSDQHVLLSDFENAVLALSPSYLLVHTDRLTPEVEAFGYLLYEMVTGRVPPTPDLLTPKPLRIEPELAPSLTPGIVSVMRLIFESEASSAPTLLTLLEHPFFAVARKPSELQLPETSPTLSTHLQTLTRNFYTANNEYLSSERKRQVKALRGK